jgi:hypothetical protein
MTNYDFGVADDYSALPGYYSAIEPYEGSLSAYLGYTYSKYPRLSFIRQLQEQGSVGFLFRSI